MSSLHQRITADIAAAIRSGAWPPGHRIPFETELAARYACSRATANKAVQALAAAGLVERRRKAGSFVARPPIHAGVLAIPDIEAAILARGEAYGFRQKSWKLARPGGTAEEALLGAPHHMLELKGVHFAGDAPFAFEHRIINLEAVPEAADVDFTGASPGAWLLSHVAWSEARHEIAAVNPDLEAAEALRIAASRACLAVKRWTWRVGAGITYARQVFPGDALDLTATFRP
ncbi:MAG TPA: UTRA domain-containing protein [Caulobacteraceae bacterium]